MTRCLIELLMAKPENWALPVPLLLEEQYFDAK